MRKLCAVILSAAICLSVSGAPAWASEHQSTLSAGYLHARTNAPGSDNHGRQKWRLFYCRKARGNYA
ncbi:enterobacterial Ail/Lom family protein [Escherichia coli]|nr:enterobacterial Ail/Lom family protein [Escherichia coli]